MRLRLTGAMLAAGIVPIAAQETPSPERVIGNAGYILQIAYAAPQYPVKILSGDRATLGPSDVNRLSACSFELRRDGKQLAYIDFSLVGDRVRPRNMGFFVDGAPKASCIAAAGQRVCYGGLSLFAVTQEQYDLAAAAIGVIRDSGCALPPVVAPY